MAEKTKKKNSKSVATTAVDISRSMILGEWISSVFFSRYKFTIVVIVGLLMLYITFKYECQTNMERINKLEKELSVIKSESVRERSTFRSRTRESMMQHRIDSLGLNLTVQTQPPFILSYED